MAQNEKNSKQKIYDIKECMGCPFNHSMWDDFAVESDTIFICSFARWKNYDEHIIDIGDYIDFDEDSTIETPKWCPLKNEGEQVFRYNGQ